MEKLRSASHAIQEHLPHFDGSHSGLDQTSAAPFPHPVNHEAHMQYALEVAKQATPKPTNFSIGAVIVDETENRILTTGYTNELPGNTHAEQCALQKLEKKIEATPSQWLSPDARLVLYTTMEPCNKRASGNTPCTTIILDFNNARIGTKEITKVFFGVKEPETFVEANTGKEKLKAAGIQFEHVSGLEREILEVATAGHLPKPGIEPSAG